MKFFALIAAAYALKFETGSDEWMQRKLEAENNAVGSDEWLEDRFESRILRYDPHIEQDIADQVRNIEKRRWAIAYLKDNSDAGTWDPKENWNPDESLDYTNQKMLEDLMAHEESENAAAEGELLD